MKKKDNKKPVAYKDMPNFNRLVEEVRAKKHKKTERVSGYEQRYKDT